MQSHYHYLLILFLNLAVTVYSGGVTNNKYSRDDFPPGFVFGAATSAYQVEGAVNEDGRTPSVWDTFTHKLNIPGGDVAVDQYHRYKEDVKLMVETGLEGYRFSISWPRLLPNGRGPVNPKGLQYYNNLINELVSQGIQVHVTLLNYDYPQSLEDEYGGWINRKIVKDFTIYADVCFREFGDRVSTWTTINEPNIFAFSGYGLGGTPPGRCSPPGLFNCSKGNSSSEPYLAAYHMLLAHASAVRLYRNIYQGKQHGLIGINLFAWWLLPLTNSIEDLAATERAKSFYFGWFMDPLVFGDYPEIMKKKVGSRLPVLSKQESKLVKGAFDFIGVIHYTTVYVKDTPTSRLEEGFFIADMAAIPYMNKDDEKPYAIIMDEYPIRPRGLQQVLEHIKQTYDSPPVYIFENGQVSLHNSSLEDTSRVEYLQAYIGSLLDAIRNGSDVRGYFVWSFLDLFEIVGNGFEATYGLYFVDVGDPNLTRKPKQSAYWYSNFLKNTSSSSDSHNNTTIQLERQSTSSFRPEL